MNREELIKYIQEKATTSDLVKIADIFDMKMDMPDNINGKYFHINDEYSDDYAKILDSNYNSKYDEYEVSKCLYVSDGYIALYSDVDPIILKKDDEIPKEVFIKIYNKVLSEIQKNV